MCFQKCEPHEKKIFVSVFQFAYLLDGRARRENDIRYIDVQILESISCMFFAFVSGVRQMSAEQVKHTLEDSRRYESRDKRMNQETRHQM